MSFHFLSKIFFENERFPIVLAKIRNKINCWRKSTPANEPHFLELAWVMPLFDVFLRVPLNCIFKCEHFFSLKLFESFLLLDMAASFICRRYVLDDHGQFFHIKIWTAIELKQLFLFRKQLIVDLWGR